MRVSSVWSVAGMVVAFLASQHHLVHMLMLMVGLGSASMSGMLMVSTVRRAMLLLSLAMVGVALWRARHVRRSYHHQLLSGVSAVVTLALAIYSVIQFGW